MAFSDQIESALSQAELTRKGWREYVTRQQLLEQYGVVTPEVRDDLRKIALSLAERGKGFLAADESTGTIGKRFAGLNIESNDETQRFLRTLLFTTENIENYFSAVILFKQQARMPDLLKPLRDKKINLMVKSDGGLDGDPSGEQTSRALEEAYFYLKDSAQMDLYIQDLAQFKADGFASTKFRIVVKIDPANGLPTDKHIHNSMEFLVLTAMASQHAGLVPVVEPETLMDGKHSWTDCATATAKALTALYDNMQRHKVYLAGTVLKTNMVVPGKEYEGADAAETRTPEFVAKATVDLLLKTVPADVPSIDFLSGGLSDQDAAIYLNAMNVYIATLAPEIIAQFQWMKSVSFSYGRALQQPVFDIFKSEMDLKAEDKSENTKTFLEREDLYKTAQSDFSKQAKACSDAAKGELDVKAYKALFSK